LKAGIAYTNSNLFTIFLGDARMHAPDQVTQQPPSQAPTGLAFRCFGASTGGGNPALVFEGDQSSEAERQQMARSFRTTLVFIDTGATSPGYSLDYFYPHARSPLCVHATLAAAQALLSRPGAAPELSVRTAMRGQELILSKAGDTCFVRLAVHAAAQPELSAPALRALLKAPDLEFLSPPAVASAGSPKLLVEVKDAAALHSLQPDLPAIAAWRREHGVNGCFAYCKVGEGIYEGRNFNHLDPALEDCATGVAAGALALHLRRDLTLLQGAGLGQPCRIEARHEGGDAADDAGGAGAQVLVGGLVETMA
jgi:PhzF family phenazine biosynthesis protein